MSASRNIDHLIKGNTELQLHPITWHHYKSVGGMENSDLPISFAPFCGGIVCTFNINKKVVFQLRFNNRKSVLWSQNGFVPVIWYYFFCHTRECNYLNNALIFCYNPLVPSCLFMMEKEWLLSLSSNNLTSNHDYHKKKCKYESS